MTELGAVKMETHTFTCTGTAFIATLMIHCVQLTSIVTCEGMSAAQETLRMCKNKTQLKEKKGSKKKAAKITQTVKGLMWYFIVLFKEEKHRYSLKIIWLKLT